jgi:NAD(P)-dependent dehydrogenase (short-subunit alcohol dehydrogenase family)
VSGQPSPRTTWSQCAGNDTDLTPRAVNFEVVKWTAARLPDLGGRVAIVTGGNSGIGWRTAQALAAHNARVVIACRNLDRGSAAARKIRTKTPTADVVAAELDLASIASVRAFAGGWSGPLHVLVNNAGVMAPPKPATTEDGFELQFGTNHLGHFVLTGLLLPALLAAGSGRVVTVASVAHHGGGDDVIDANFGPGYNAQHTYSNSKLANLLFAAELDRQVRARDLPLLSVAAHPGVSATGLVSDPQGMGANRLIRAVGPVFGTLFTQSARAGARGTLYAATEAAAGSYTGPRRFGETRGPIGPARRSPLAQDEKLARRLWQLSEDITGYRYTWPAPARDAVAQPALK